MEGLHYKANTEGVVLVVTLGLNSTLAMVNTVSSLGSVSIVMVCWIEIIALILIWPNPNRNLPEPWQ